MNWALENADVLWAATVEHMALVAQALIISAALALPLGIVSARRPRLYGLVLAAAGIFYTLPALALFALLIPFMGLGRAPAVTALVAYSLLILTRNVVVGLRQVPADVIEAADGMGYGPAGRLWRVELPLALPVIVAGLRLTLVMQISTATIAAFIGAGGLGDLIFQGITQDFSDKIIVGAAVTALLAVSADETLRRVEQRLRAIQGGRA